MPEFTPDEADHCPHCNAILRDPPNCCEAMRAEADAEWKDRLLRGKQRDKNDPDPGWEMEEWYG